MNVEMLKHKETQKDLSSALTMINKLESQLLAKDRAVPGSKILLKRESKTVMPMIANKSIEMQSKMSISDDGFLSREDGRRKSQTSGSPDSELELLVIHLFFFYAFFMFCGIKLQPDWLNEQQP